MHRLTIYSWFGFPIPMNEYFKLIKAAGLIKAVLQKD